MADTHEATLRWPRTDANDVIVSGDFDKWSNSIHMTKDATGFEAKVKVPWGTTVEYKFLVDGHWKTSENAPTETDPSGRFVNNAYTAPAKPVSAVSSAISFVTGAFQTLTGVEPSSLSNPPPEPLSPIESTTKEAPAVSEVAPTTTFPIVPVKDASTDLPASPSSEAKAPVLTSTEEASTHKPVNVSRAQSSEKVPKDTNVPAPAPVVPGSATETVAVAPTPAPEPTAPEVPPAVPETVSASETAAPVETPTPAAPVETLVEAVTPAAAAEVPAKTDEPAAAVSTTEDKPATNGVNGKHSPQASLSAARASLSLQGKAPFPTASEDSTLSKGTGRSFSGTSSIKKKRGSVFGGSRASQISASEDGTESPSGSVRTKKRSIFGKIKHMFDDKDKEKIPKK